MPNTHPTELAPDALRWRYDSTTLGFETTREIDPASEIIGQPAAREALRFGLECDAPGQNVYVRGARGTGRRSMVRQLLRELRPVSHAKRDRCYVHNFSRLDRPRLITLGAGQARGFRQDVCALAEFIRDSLMKALESEPYASARNAMQERVQANIQTLTTPLEAELQQAGMALVPIQQGTLTQTVILPVVNGQPVPPPQFQQLVAQGQIPPQRQQQFEAQYPEFQRRLQAIGREVNEATRAGAREVVALNERATRSLLGQLTQPILEQFPGDDVRKFIEEVTTDVIENRLRAGAELPDPTVIYGVNIVLEHIDPTRRPVVEENAPRIMNLLGVVEPEWGPNGMASSDYRGVRAGALLQADCGYLILEVADLISEPGAWQALMRTLRTGRLEIVPPEINWMRPNVVVQPDPIQINVRVILIGDAANLSQQVYFWVRPSPLAFLP